MRLFRVDVQYQNEDTGAHYVAAAYIQSAEPVLREMVRNIKLVTQITDQGEIFVQETARTI